MTVNQRAAISLLCLLACFGGAGALGSILFGWPGGYGWWSVPGALAALVLVACGLGASAGLDADRKRGSAQ